MWLFEGGSALVFLRLLTLGSVALGALAGLVVMAFVW